MADIPIAYALGKWLINRELVVNEQLLAHVNARRGLDEYPARVFHRFTVGSACVVKPPRTVTAATTIDHSVIRQRKMKGVPDDTPLLHADAPLRVTSSRRP